MTQPKHIHQVDYIRAIASVAVALFHLGGKSLPVLKYGWLGVHMFFLLSGFIICKAIPRNYSWRLSGKFISKRIIRIEPPYIISIAVVLLVNLLLAGLGLIPSAHPDWLNLLGHLAYINNFTGAPYINPVYWTLGIEFQFYLFVAIAFPLIVGRWGTWFLLALCILSHYIHIPGSTLLGLFPVFALGILYYLYFTKQITRTEALLFGLPVALISCFSIGCAETAAALFAVVILALPLKSNKVIRFFSAISFSLYLTHDTVGSKLVAFMGQSLPKTLPFKALEFGTGIIVSITFAWVFYLVVEAPFLKLSKRVVYS
ncbi:acyltransferase [Mucilaginibacter sp. ZT4R22]|uniref:Acyltransferase n=1 Tax=Mucilaginibacter pankratovii TaxID=2772110 RepID=A0ABR7X041_9SPHI|nr:acyltransferase [Mucilaginibacter pankratovii]MBD1366887.1 acyltransferase [Mucilaginibacter pankratovii]